MKKAKKITKARRPATLNKKRSREAADLIARLVKRGMNYTQIAAAVRASERSVYRWAHDGMTPHPLMLDGLRRLVATTPEAPAKAAAKAPPQAA